MFSFRSKVLMICSVALTGVGLVLFGLFSSSDINKPIDLAADDRGGFELVLEVDESALLKRELLKYRTEMNAAFRNAEDRPRNEFVRLDEESILARMRSKEDADKAELVLQALYESQNSLPFLSLEAVHIERVNDRDIQVSVSKEFLQDKRKAAARRELESLACRWDPKGEHGLNFVIQGDNQILVQAPGFKDFDSIASRYDSMRVKRDLAFHLVNEDITSEEPVPSPYEFYPFAGFGDPNSGLTVNTRTRIGIDCFLRLDVVSKNENGPATVQFVVDDMCIDEFKTFAENNLGQRYAVILGGEIYSSAVITSQISKGKGLFKVGPTHAAACDFVCSAKAGWGMHRLNVVAERIVLPS